MVKNGPNRGNCQKILIVAVQAVELYGSEVWWKGQEGTASEVQK